MRSAIPNGTKEKNGVGIFGRLHFLHATAFASSITSSTYLAAELGADGAENGLLQALPALVSLAAGTAWARFSARVGLSLCLVACFGLSAAAYGLLFFAQDLMQFGTARLILGLSMGHIILINAGVLDHATSVMLQRQLLSRLSAAYMGGVILGGICAPVLAMPGAAWPQLFAAVTCLVGVLLAMCGKAQTKGTQLRSTLPPELRTKFFARRPFLAYIGLSLGLSLIVANLALILNTVVGVPASIAYLPGLIFALVGIAANLGVARRLLRPHVREGCLLLGLCLAVAGITADFAWLCIACAVAGVGLALTKPAIAATLTSGARGSHLTQAVARLQLTDTLTQIIAPLAGGIAIARGVGWLIGVLAAMALAGSATLYRTADGS